MARSSEKAENAFSSSSTFGRDTLNNNLIPRIPPDIALKGSALFFFLMWHNYLILVNFYSHLSYYHKDGALFRIYQADFVISRVSASKKESGLETMMSANRFFNIVPKEKKEKFLTKKLLSSLVRLTSSESFFRMPSFLAFSCKSVTSLKIWQNK